MRTSVSQLSRMNCVSAASLRGLTGHQTQPAREMPNTQAKAMGSLPESTAIFAPGRTPAAATAQAKR